MEKKRNNRSHEPTLNTETKHTTDMKSKYFVIGLLTLIGTGISHGQNMENDLIDVLHYNIEVDLGHRIERQVSGSTTIKMLKVAEGDSMELGLYNAIIDSIEIEGECAESYGYDLQTLRIGIGRFAIGDTMEIAIYYRTSGKVEPRNFGGFHFENNIYYNLGIAFADYPPSYGRSWFPCRDNFYDKATFRLRLTGPVGWSIQSSGICRGVERNDDGSETSEWEIATPASVYGLGVATAPFHYIHRDYVGKYGVYAATLGYLNHDSTSVQRAFDNMGRVIPYYEELFGPYRWGRIGYVATPMGSMEHVNNIALSSSMMASMGESAQMTIAHEFSHSWFGNLVTAASPSDMWFNEGGASFCEELAMEAIYADSDGGAAQDYYERNLESVLRTAHKTDRDYYALYDLPDELVYGTTTYNKGAVVWHTLRGYMGDSIFYQSLKKLFTQAGYKALTTAEVRDSLTAYSGIDLTDFFDFYVYRPGFNDFVIDEMRTEDGETKVTIRQKTVGTEEKAKSNRIPITFYSAALDTVTIIAQLDSTEGEVSCRLPYTPAYAVVNYDKRLGLAATSADIDLRQGKTYELPLEHFTCTARRIDSTQVNHLHITHHWVKPDRGDDRGIVRMANRYWSIEGVTAENAKMGGSFEVAANGDGMRKWLDDGFYSQYATADSLRLMYRKDSRSEWTVAAKKITGSWEDGCFTVMTLKQGEYTLAVVDTNTLDIEEVSEKPNIDVYPNPSKGRITIACGKSMRMDVVSMTGAVIVRGKEIIGDATISLPEGVYLLKFYDEAGIVGMKKVVVE